MYYKEIAPAKILEPYLKCFWVLEDPVIIKNKPLEKILPDACPELIINYGSLFQIKDSAGKIKKQPKSFVFGPLTKHIEIGPTGATGVIAARFYPGGLAAFLPVPLKEITNTYSSLSSLFGKKGRDLELAVCQAKTLNDRKKIIEDFLIMLLSPGNQYKPLIPKDAIDRIINSSDPVKIDRLSKQLNIGRRHLERKFNAQVGMTPKLFLKIVRFQNVFKIISKKKIKSLTDLTYDAGYFDQSHFYRDFKEFSGHSPKEHFKENAQLTKLFTNSL